MAEYDSPFKPIVSGSDYLSGSEFGQVAGALLSRRDKQDKKQASISVIRAMTRINDHINRQASRSIVWDRRSILHPSITS